MGCVSNNDTVVDADEVTEESADDVANDVTVTDSGGGADSGFVLIAYRNAPHIPHPARPTAKTMPAARNIFFFIKNLNKKSLARNNPDSVSDCSECGDLSGSLITLGFKRLIRPGRIRSCTHARILPFHPRRYHRDFPSKDGTRTLSSSGVSVRTSRVTPDSR